MVDEISSSPNGAEEFGATRSQADSDSPLNNGPKYETVPGDPRGWLQRLLRKKDSQTGMQGEPAQDQQSKTETKSGGIMAELDAKNGELGGNLLHKFGEGQGQFMVLNGPSRISQEGYGVDKYLAATNEGYKVLAVRIGRLTPNPNSPDQQYTDSDDAGSLANSMVLRLISRDDPNVNRNGSDAIERSGFSHEGNRFVLNFGKDHTIEFSDPIKGGKGEVAYLQSPNKTIQEFAATAARTYTRMDNRSKQILSDIVSHARIYLEPNPSPDEVEAIMQGSYKAAEGQYKRQQ